MARTYHSLEEDLVILMCELPNLQVLFCVL
jgi:hypothetical protein